MLDKCCGIGVIWPHVGFSFLQCVHNKQSQSLLFSITSSNRH